MDLKDDLKTIIELYIEEHKTNTFNKNELLDLVDYCHNSLVHHYETDFDFDLIKKEIKNLLYTIYIYDQSKIIDKNNEDVSDTKTNEELEYDKLEEHYFYLLNLPQPEQKSQAWFDMRNNMITASSAAQAMGESKYDTLDQFI